MSFFFSPKRTWLLLLAVSLTVPLAALARKFDPPRIIAIIHERDTGASTSGQTDEGTLYYMNKGQETNLSRGEILNVYREKQIHPSIPRPLRIFIGTMTITESQTGSSMGHFTPNANIDQPIIKFKAPIKGDIVVPRLIIDSGVLFDPGKADLKPGAGQEFAKVAGFVQNFAPNKIVIEGHTDSDGEENANQLLSDNRAEVVRQFLINAYSFILPGMIEAKGFGENQPIVENSSPENKALNRRIEVVVWE